MTETREHWIQVEGARLHGIEISEEGPGGTGDIPDILYLPGLAGIAEDAVRSVEKIKARRRIMVSMRGRGQSRTDHDACFSSQVHARDLLAICSYFSLDHYALISYSMSCLYAILAYAQKGFLAPERLVLCDFPPGEMKLDGAWVFSMQKLFGEKGSGKISDKALMGISRDSVSEDYSAILSSITSRVLLMVGGKNSNVPGLLTSGDLYAYKDKIKSMELVFFETGHFFKDSEPEKFAQALNTFIGSKDPG